MSDSEYSSVRSINSVGGGRRKGSKKGRKGSKKGRKGSRKGSKGRNNNVDSFIDSVLGDVSMPKQQTPQMNGLSNPMNLQYDPLHVNFMVSPNGKSAPSQFDMSAMGMMGGQMNNGLAQQFQGMDMGMAPQMMPQGMDMGMAPQMMPQGMDMGMTPQMMPQMMPQMEQGVEQPMMMPQMNQKNLVDIPDVSGVDAAPQIGGGHVNIPYGLYF
jgi:hypothetical protein